VEIWEGFGGGQPDQEGKMPADGVDECFGLLASVEPRVTYPDRRLFGQVMRSPT
jgi:hypothetical protein